MGSGKFWRSRLRSLTSVSVLSITALHGAAAQPGADESGAEARNRAAQGEAAEAATLDAFLDGVQTLTADFTQELWNADRELLQTDTGSLALKRPNRFLWTYEQPAELTVAADGMRLWIYDVELAQITVTPFDDTVGTSPAMLLSGGSSVREEFDVVDAYSLEGLEWIKLEPRGSSDFSSVLIGFGGKAPRRLELVDGLGQVTRIELDNLVVNPEIPDRAFELEVPEGVDVIGGDG